MWFNLKALDKKVLRDTYLWKRKLLTVFEKNQRENKLLANVKELISPEMKTIHIFLPIEKNAEINTWPIIDYLKQHQKQVVVSRSNLSDNSMTNYVYEGKSQLEINKWGIPEPRTGEIVEPSVIDLVFIPLIIFDRIGHRIGYGKGYYDRFLKSCSPSIKKVGLSISPPLDKILFANDHDVKMDFCVTHLGIYKF